MAPDKGRASGFLALLEQGQEIQVTGGCMNIQRTLNTRVQFIDWLSSQDPSHKFEGGSCTKCALAVYTGQEVVINTYGPYGHEYKLPRWALRFNLWATGKGFTPSQALQAIKRGYKP